MLKRFWIGFAVILLAFIASACGTSNQSTGNSQKVQVVASLDFYGEVAKTVGGDHVTVTNIINNPDVDPHDYEPTTKVGTQVAKADLVLANGIGYDGWMDKLVKSSATKGQTYYKVGDDLMGKKEGDNEHIWYDPETMPKLATEVAKLLAKKDPKHKADFEANAKKYIANLKPVTDLVASLKQSGDPKQVAVSEPVFDYSLAYLGYKVANEHFALSTEDGTDYSAKDINDLENSIKAHKIAFFVNNSQASSKTVSRIVDLAKANDVPVLNVTETLPSGKTYKTWMLSQYQALEKIQKADIK